MMQCADRRICMHGAEYWSQSGYYTAQHFSSAMTLSARFDVGCLSARMPRVAIDCALFASSKVSVPLAGAAHDLLCAEERLQSNVDPPCALLLHLLSPSLFFVSAAAAAAQLLRCCGRRLPRCGCSRRVRPSGRRSATPAGCLGRGGRGRGGDELGRTLLRR
jgi:hypothetical protein